MVANVHAKYHGKFFVFVEHLIAGARHKPVEIDETELDGMYV